MPRVLVLLAAVCFGTTGTAQALGPSAAAPLTVGAARIAIGGLLLLVAARAVPAATAAWPRRELGLIAVAIAVYQLVVLRRGRSHRGRRRDRRRARLGARDRRARRADRRRRAAHRALGARHRAGLRGRAALVLGGGGSSADPLGIILAVVAGTGYATYTVFAKRLLRRGHAPERVMAASFSLGAVLLAPVLVAGDMRWLATGDGLAMALFLGAVPDRARLRALRPRAARADARARPRRSRSPSR